MSLVVLLVTGYGWSNYRHLLNGLATSDVADGGGADGAVDILLVGMDSRTDAHGNPLPEDVLREEVRIALPVLVLGPGPLIRPGIAQRLVEMRLPVT